MIKKISSLPHTQAQLAGITEPKRSTQFTNSQKRVRLGTIALGNVIILPFDAPIRTLVNSFSLPFFAGKAVVTGGIAVFNKNYRQKAKKDSLAFVDRVFTLMLSPAYIPARLTFLFLGILRPSFVYKDPSLMGAAREISNKLTRANIITDWKKTFAKDQVNLERAIPLSDINADRYISLVLLSAIMKRSMSCGVALDNKDDLKQVEDIFGEEYFTDEEYLSNRYDWKQLWDNFLKTPDDDIEVKQELLIAFDTLLNNWKDNPKEMKAKNLIKFLDDNFKSPKQQAFLKMLFGQKLDEDEHGQQLGTPLIRPIFLLQYSAHRLNFKGNDFENKISEKMIEISESLNNTSPSDISSEESEESEESSESEELSDSDEVTSDTDEGSEEAPIKKPSIGDID